MPIPAGIAKRDSEGYFMDKPIHLELTGLGGLYSEGYQPNIEGTWSFEWNLQRSDMVRECSPGTALRDSGALVDKIEISPISVQVTYQFPRTEITEKGYNDSGEEIEANMLAEPPKLQGIKMKDGTIYSCLTLIPAAADLFQMRGKNTLICSDSTEFWIPLRLKAFYF